MADPVFSPDGQFMWDGSQWIPAPPASQSQATHGLGTNLHDSVMQATGDIIQGTSTRIDRVVINQTAAQPVQSSIPTAPVTPSTENCTNCLQPITFQNTRLKCQFINHKNQASCTETFCSSCELWWTQTARPPSIAPLCQTHFDAKKQERRAKKKQEKSQYICYNVIERHFVVPQNPLNSETKKKLIFIPILIGWVAGFIPFFIFMENDLGFAVLTSFAVWFCGWLIVQIISLGYLEYTNKEYKLYFHKWAGRHSLKRWEKHAKHQQVIQILIDWEEYQLLKVYKETYGLE